MEIFDLTKIYLYLIFRIVFSTIYAYRKTYKLNINSEEIIYWLLLNQYKYQGRKQETTFAFPCFEKYFSLRTYETYETYENTYRNDGAVILSISFNYSSQTLFLKFIFTRVQNLLWNMHAEIKTIDITLELIASVELTQKVSFTVYSARPPLQQILSSYTGHNQKPPCVKCRWTKYIQTTQNYSAL